MHCLYSILLGLAVTWSGGECFVQGECYHDKFQCHVTRKCINRDMVRNKIFNCGSNDTSDEDQPLARCHSQTEHRCRGNGQCVPRHWINRAISLCADFSDKGRIAGFPCNENTEFRCSEGRCITRRQVMNGNINCSPDGNDEQEAIPCHSKTEFRCSVNGRCILRSQVLNGARECPNGEDESVCLAPSCRNETDEFLCGSGQCIPRHYVGDGIQQCLNGDDEKMNLTHCLPDIEFACITNNGSTRRCISISRVNDGLKDCDDGTDESVASLFCADGLWSCDEETRCITKDMVCDGLVDCQDCSDEMVSSWCPKHKSNRYIPCSNSSVAGNTSSSDGIQSSHCILRSYFCDGIIDCLDGSDEREIGVGLKCRITKKVQGDSKTLVCLLPHQMLNDGIQDCDDGSDEFISSVATTSNHVPCLFSRHIEIKTLQICNGIFDCPDLTDECLCHVTNASEACRSVCYGGNANHKLSDACAVCPIGYMACDAGIDGTPIKCIPPSMICDFNKDCANRLDEKFCNFSNAESSLDSAVENTPFNCPLLGPLKFYSNTQDDLPLQGRLCDGVPDCFGSYDECGNRSSSETCEQIPLFCEHLAGKIKCGDYDSQPLYPWMICDGRVDCQDGTDEAYCNDTRFVCDVTKKSSNLAADSKVVDVQKVSIAKTRVCDGHVDCVDQSDELNCSDHFYCLYGESPLFIPKGRVLDGHKDCSGGSDECPDATLYARDPLSSRDHLVKQWWLRWWLWLVAMAALLGNLVVMSVSVEKIVTSFNSVTSSTTCSRRCSGRKGNSAQRTISSLSRCNDILVLNLAFADFLTGIYLIAISIKGFEFAGSYCRHEYQWKSCLSCRNIGVLLLTSCQASVGIMATLTSYRLYAVLQPWRVASLNAYVAVLVSSLVWCCSILIAVIPIMPYFRDVFTTAALLATGDGRPLYFESEIAKKSEMVTFLTRSCGLSQNENNYTLKQVCSNLMNEHVTWDIIESDWPKLSSPVSIAGYFGYYSSHGVCLPTFYPIQSDFNDKRFDYTGTLKYTTFVMSLDFVLFLYIAFAYFLVSYQATKNMKSLRRGSNLSGEERIPTNQEKAAAKRITKMHKRVGRLVATDFTCWIPTCLIAFFGVSGYPIPAWVYSFTAVVLLPINSALNPILYSDVILKFIRRKILFCIRPRTKESLPHNNTSTGQSNKLLVKPYDSSNKAVSVKEDLAGKKKQTCLQRIRNLFSNQNNNLPRRRSSICGSSVENVNMVQHTTVTIAHVDHKTKKTTTL